MPMIQYIIRGRQREPKHAEFPVVSEVASSASPSGLRYANSDGTDDIVAARCGQTSPTSRRVLEKSRFRISKSQIPEHCLGMRPRNGSCLLNGSNNDPVALAITLIQIGRMGGEWTDMNRLVPTYQFEVLHSWQGGEVSVSVPICGHPAGNVDLACDLYRLGRQQQMGKLQQNEKQQKQRIKRVRLKYDQPSWSYTWQGGRAVSDGLGSNTGRPRDEVRQCTYTRSARNLELIFPRQVLKISCSYGSCYLGQDYLNTQVWSAV